MNIRFSEAAVPKPASSSGCDRHARKTVASLVAAAFGATLICGPLTVPGVGAPAETSPTIVRALIVRGSSDYASFNQPLGVALDTAHREIYVANSGYGRIDVYSYEGRFKAQLPHYLEGADGTRSLGTPAALAVDRRGRVFVIDAKDSGVDVIDYRGRSIGRLELRSVNGGRVWPSAVAIARDDRIFVATGGDSGRVFVFTPALEPAGSWGEPGNGQGHVSNTMAMAIAPGGELILARTDDEPAIQVFTSDGRFVRGFGYLANGNGNFAFPTGLTVTPDGRIWVCDQIRQSIQVFDSTGTYLATLGDFGRGPGQFNYPYSLAADGAGLFAITERMGARMQLWSVR